MIARILILILPALKWWGMRHPYRHIGNYMDRYWIIPGLVRLHRIKRADRGIHLHDRPWSWRTFVLSGGYVERTLDGYIPRIPGSTAARHYSEWHHIARVEPDTWTLFIHGPRRQTWGFLVDGKKVYHHDYNKTMR